MNDMRVLVIDYLAQSPAQSAPVGDELAFRAEAPAHSSHNSGVLGHAYLHLAMCQLDEPCEMDLSVYDEQSEEIAKAGLLVHIDFSPHGVLRNSGSSSAAAHAARLLATHQHFAATAVEESLRQSADGAVEPAGGTTEAGPLNTPTWLGDSFEFAKPTATRRSRNGEK